MVKYFILILILASSSSAEGTASDCSKIRESQLAKIIMDTEINGVRLRGQKVEILSLQNQLNVINSEINEDNFALEFRSQYKHSGTGLYEDDQATTNYSEQQVSANYSLSRALWLKRQIDIARGDLAKLKSANKQRQHESDLLKKLIELKKLHSILELTLSKLPLIEKKIDYYTLLGKLSSDGFRELAAAELEKIKVGNEIQNTQSRIKLENALFTQSSTNLRNIIANFGFGSVSTNVGIGRPCQFIDRETEQKLVEIKVASRELAQSKSEAYPSLNVSSSISSRDYHSGDQKNNFSVGVGITVPIVDGGSRSTKIQDKAQKLKLLGLEEAELKQEHDIKLENFVTLEKSTKASILESQEKLKKLNGDINELRERQNMGQSNFEELVTKQIQEADITIIYQELQSRLLSLWADHWENLVAE